MFIQVVHLKWFWYSRLLTWVNLSIQKRFGWGSTNLESLDYFEQEESLHSLQFIFRLKSTFNDMKSNHLSYTCTKLCITRFDVCVVTKIMFSLNDNSFHLSHCFHTKIWIEIIFVTARNMICWRSKSYFVTARNPPELKMHSRVARFGVRGLVEERFQKSRNLEI